MIAREVGLPRSTTYEHLQAVIDEGFVVHLPEEFKYALGDAAHELGTGFPAKPRSKEWQKVPVSKLVDRTRRTAHLGSDARQRCPVRHRGTRSTATAPRNRHRSPPSSPFNGQWQGHARLDGHGTSSRSLSGPRSLHCPPHRRAGQLAGAA